MNLFYEPELEPQVKDFLLNEQEASHAIRVLRLKEGEEIHLTNGRGGRFSGIISDTTKKSCKVKITGYQEDPEPETKLYLGIALIKNRARMEWILEKATEIGIYGFILFHSSQTERSKARTDRFEKILISAMKQSLGSRLPTLTGPLDFPGMLELPLMNKMEKYIGWCETKETLHLVNQYKKGSDAIFLTGPEGDFTREEIKLAKQNGFSDVSLGQNRLRSETAGIFALSLFHAINMSNNP